MGMRSARVLRPDTVYHITARANRKEKLLEPKAAKELFLETLAGTRKRFQCRIDSFMVMENHVHLLLQPLGAASLAAIMGWLLGVYSQRYNGLFKTWGHVWGGRYYSRPIAGFPDLLRTFQYIDDNPVRACLVRRAEDWEWGALRHYRSGRTDIVGPPPAWLAAASGKHSLRRIAALAGEGLSLDSN